jgi:hypothetical protein
MNDPTPHTAPDEVMLRIGEAIPVIYALAADTATIDEETTATDETGTVRVVFAADGLPQLIQVGADWRRTVGGDGLAAAVTTACARAGRSYDAKIGDATDGSGWVARFNEVVRYIASIGPPPPGLVAPPPLPETPDVSMSMARLHALEEVSAALGSPEDVVNRMHVGTGAAGRLRLTLAEWGAMTCDADPDWLRRTESAEIEQALAAALADLRAERDAAAAAHQRSVAAYQDTVAALPGARAYVQPDTGYPDRRA